MYRQSSSSTAQHVSAKRRRAVSRRGSLRSAQSVRRPSPPPSQLTHSTVSAAARLPPRSLGRRTDGRTSGRTCSERRRRRLGRQTRPYTAAATRRCSRRRRLARRRRHPTFGRVLGGRSGERSDARALAADGDGYGASCLSPSPPPPTLHALALPPPRSPCSLAAAMALAWRSQLLLPPHME